MTKRDPRHSRGAAKPPTARTMFDLAAVERVPVRSLVRHENDAVGRLVIRLAAAFNDLKSAHHVLERLGKLEPAASDGDRGERAGLVIHATRLAGAVMYETLNVLREETKTLALPEVIDARERLPRVSRRVWDEMVSLSKDPAEAAKKPLLWYVRNKSASHYDVDLVRGFLRGFEELRSADGDPAYSDGESMEQTRFYFADVAVRAVVATETGTDIAEIERIVIEQTNRANLALKPMLIELIRARAAQMPQRGSA